MSLVGFFKNAGLFIMGNNQFKLIFPSHAMPFTLPGGEIPNIVAKVDQLLCDMEKKGITKYGGFTIPASDGGTITIDMPTTGDWVLVDTYYKTVIHASLATSMVVVGGTYMVLPLRAAGLKAADLKRACEEAAAPSLPTMASPPPRYNEESQ